MYDRAQIKASTTSRLLINSVFMVCLPQNIFSNVHNALGCVQISTSEQHLTHNNQKEGIISFVAQALHMFRLEVLNFNNTRA